MGVGCAGTTRRVSLSGRARPSQRSPRSRSHRRSPGTRTAWRPTRPTLTQAAPRTTHGDDHRPEHDPRPLGHRPECTGGAGDHARGVADGDDGAVILSDPERAIPRPRRAVPSWSRSPPTAGRGPSRSASSWPPTRPILYTPLDDKPKRTDDPLTLARVRDIAADPRVSILADRWDEDWTRLAWLRAEGRRQPARCPDRRARARGRGPPGDLPAVRDAIGSTTGRSSGSRSSA